MGAILAGVCGAVGLSLGVPTLHHEGLMQSFFGYRFCDGVIPA